MSKISDYYKSIKDYLQSLLKTAGHSEITEIDNISTSIRSTEADILYNDTRSAGQIHIQSIEDMRHYSPELIREDLFQKLSGQGGDKPIFPKEAFATSIVRGSPTVWADILLGTGPDREMPPLVQLAFDPEKRRVRIAGPFLPRGKFPEFENELTMRLMDYCRSHDVESLHSHHWGSEQAAKYFDWSTGGVDGSFLIAAGPEYEHQHWNVKALQETLSEFKKGYPPEDIKQIEDYIKDMQNPAKYRTITPRQLLELSPLGQTIMSRVAWYGMWKPER